MLALSGGEVGRDVAGFDFFFDGLEKLRVEPGLIVPPGGGEGFGCAGVGVAGAGVPLEDSRPCLSDREEASGFEPVGSSVQGTEVRGRGGCGISLSVVVVADES